MSRDAWKVRCSYRSRMPCIQYLTDSNTQSISLFRGVFISLHFSPTLSLSTSSFLFLSPTLPLPTSHSLHFFSTTSLPLQTPVSVYLSLSLSHTLIIPHLLSSTLSLLIQRNAVCGKLWLFGYWYLRLCSTVSDFHRCFEWDCARTSVCFLPVLFICMCSCMFVPLLRQ